MCGIQKRLMMLNTSVWGSYFWRIIILKESPPPSLGGLSAGVWWSRAGSPAGTFGILPGETNGYAMFPDSKAQTILAPNIRITNEVLGAWQKILVLGKFDQQIWRGMVERPAWPSSRGSPTAPAGTFVLEPEGETTGPCPSIIPLHAHENSLIIRNKSCTVAWALRRVQTTAPCGGWASCASFRLLWSTARYVGVLRHS